ncbi:hypothetical protein QMK19_03320 [Streptomyces sp. H10-C2]|uniref:hypothetical protein n=1 Tax=unclassified Streptomyces TaxID=2593676 RepID=UPI0024BBC132|nr:MULTISPECIES: hypothetical protein [unclassified Streptomyces]MDJ0342216.1 hypothetical protein [Streptomyces sp. PH10-H1]MDJ0368730.1 hypothetical protein [Streptomyces sp. H10-C2]
MTIQAIETYYGGHRFRSRLEARWAVVFDSLNLRWEYEPQGYRIGESRRPYLPDFYLTDLNWWIEVKGAEDRLDLDLLCDAVHPTQGLGRADGFHMTNLLILGGIPRAEGTYAHWSISRSAAIGTNCGGSCAFTGPRYGLHQFMPVPDARRRGSAGLAGDDLDLYDELYRRGSMIQPACRSTTQRPDIDMTRALPIADGNDLPHLDAAYLLGRTARFEHGEAA